MQALLDRLKEPSSYAALSALLLLVGINIDPGLWQYAVGALTALAGVVGFLLSEKPVIVSKDPE